ncbi:hypothetical protein NDU88_002346 [Pleurodeles waltl]|uniref:Secreted protein n=1 Tax=Pleurodeles waltl TaxID=8319 RepID=A0AAV7SAN5_PLEWA|nr:hypothetical protein NDU88_002346 [Pleurodeles waltl]
MNPRLPLTTPVRMVRAFAACPGPAQCRLGAGSLAPFLSSPVNTSRVTGEAIISMWRRCVVSGARPKNNGQSTARHGGRAYVLQLARHCSAFHSLGLTIQALQISNTVQCLTRFVNMYRRLTES